ncbi:unnamed protein product [Clonostachys rosea f. rosea IK726]|uniref:Uncharacterized protein n=1 Tax=Clonostachys rosea f. rosea IK726 TaxID=1349383 RepID=A0ACA9UBY5_BIOOC|nr:unnamed protein product [Clonostachys rosea f. rosea IK726]
MCSELGVVFSLSIGRAVYGIGGRGLRDQGTWDEEGYRQNDIEHAEQHRTHRENTVILTERRAVAPKVVTSEPHETPKTSQNSTV